ncbi:hypothetical protein CTEN210_01201 [Chaetoceros tenuissimus]|uniref:Leucine-rich repeat domain-containing protein n=1 Tax=Chaetoceros tenuissimus TaxID=426638 RepID=A0AAD3CEN4_9STRA|nr:hypothetical protein CTEN210_01201 [Chaetoceros tenuissimus]
MRVQTEEWRRFIPGVRMYKGKKTLFYNGEKLYDEYGKYLIYSKEEQESWEVIIVLPGVEVIPEETFSFSKVEAVIMSDTVRRIEDSAFWNCTRLKHVKLPTNLEYVGSSAFRCCKSLEAIFIPPSCRKIDLAAFQGCKKLVFLNVPQHTQLSYHVIADTTLIYISPFATDHNGEYDNDREVNDWIRNLHAGNEFSLHRACCSYNPLDEVIFGIIKRQGLKTFKKQDRLGATASLYLSRNPSADTKEQKIIKRYILDMMGEVI